MISLLIFFVLGCKDTHRTNLPPSYSTGEVPFQRIVKADEAPEDWLTYSGNYFAQRHSRLAQLTPENVNRLRVHWVYQMQSRGLVETSPLIFDGIMYLTEPPSTVTALDVHTGRRLWSWKPSMPTNLVTWGFPPVNRGVAVLDDKVYVGTLDAHLVALDAKSGALRWKTLVADNATGHAITVAPLALDGKIIVGISGGEAGIRGFLDAYDAESGERLWRFWTIPGPGEAGNETWGGDSWETGAGPTWLTGSYDPELNLLYWGIGNPGPDWNGDVRPGDNLYTCSVVALNPEDGSLVWYHQFTPHDTHDWDANQIPVLFDARYKGTDRKLLGMANRNAFYYLLDRETGEYLQATPFAKQTWAERIDDSGRPVVLPNTEPTEEGNLVYPSLQGATNWFSPSYDPGRGLFFVAVREMGAYYFKTDVDYEAGQPFLGGGEQALSGDQANGYIKGIQALSGEISWEFELHTPPWSGVMSTAGGLVFGGTNEGSVFALDSRTGDLNWEFQTGGAIRTNPVSFLLDGKQMVAISGGGALFVFGL